MNILFTVDKAYLNQCCICIESFLRFGSPDSYSIYILHSDLTVDDENDIKSRFKGRAAVHPVYVDPKVFDRFPDNAKYPKLMYYRILAAEFLPEDIDRILYLDPDTAVINPLDEFYHSGFSGNMFIASTHVREFLTKINLARLRVEDDVPYINTGVMLMDVHKMRYTVKLPEILDYIEKYGEYFTLPDQDIITALYGNMTLIVPYLKYNLSDRMLAVYNTDIKNKPQSLDSVRSNTVIIHYCGSNKPWNKPYFGVLNVFYDELIKDIEKGSTDGKND